MNNSTIYDNKPEGEPLKLRPKSEYSSDFSARKIIRMVAYARVSTDKKEQEASLEAQQEYYKNYIEQRENCVFAGIYTDEASGTTVRKRKGFQKMLKDARDGKFDMIITKDASRFARNQIQGLLAIKELLSLKPPIGIIFENDSINTLREDCGVYVQFMLSMAQGEIERRSKAVKWAFKRRCEDKNYPMPTEFLLGYTKDENKNPIIEPEGEKTVKAIFAMFLHGIPISEIAFILSKSGRLTGKNRAIWSSSSVIGILRNEKHCGDMVAQKNTVVDILEHRSEKNDGREVLYYFDNHHAAIITRAEYVRSLLMLRSNIGSAYYNPRYEIRVVREGLLIGFIPLNFAFGGYDAGHYLGAYVKSDAKIGNYTVNLVAPTGFRLVRTQEMQHRFTAQMTIGYKGVTFNTDCISRMPETDFVEVLLHPAERLIAVRSSSKTNPDAIPWQSNISAAFLCPMLFDLMGWEETWKYKFIADCFVREDERVLIFNLSEPEFQFSEDVIENEEIIGKIRRLLQPEEWRNEIGADYVSQMLASRRAYALSLEDWKTQAPALPVEGFPGNPVNRSDDELQAYLELLEVEYVR